VAELGDAQEALRNYAGCTRDEAEALTRELSSAATRLALKVAAGTRPPLASAAEARFALYEELIAERDGEEVPIDALVVIFRITEGQAQTLKRNLRARNPKLNEAGLDSRFKNLKLKETGTGDTGQQWMIRSGDPDLLDYARSRLRRLGVTAEVEFNPSKGTLVFPQVATPSRGGEINTKNTLGLDEED
jgi:hypothetical protein